MLWPCRANGHVVPDHPFLYAFCVLLCVFGFFLFFKIFGMTASTDAALRLL